MGLKGGREATVSLNPGMLTLCPPSPRLPHTGPREAAADPQTVPHSRMGLPRISTPAPHLHRHTQTHLQACSRAGCLAIINNLLPPSLPQTCSTSLPTGAELARHWNRLLFSHLWEKPEGTWVLCPESWGGGAPRPSTDTPPPRGPGHSIQAPQGKGFIDPEDQVR